MSSISSSVFVGVHCYYLYTSVFDWLCLQWTWLSPRSHVRPPLEFVNVLLLIIVFHAFHNKQKKKQQDDCCSFLYVYFFNWACFGFFYLELWSVQLKKIRLELDLRLKSMWCNNCTLCKKYNKFHWSCCFVSYVIYLHYKKKIVS